MNDHDATRGGAAAPLIGITTSELRRREQVELNRHGEPAQTELSLGLAYPDAVTRAGGLPVILAPVADRDLQSLLCRLDGLVLSGGPDLHPVSYGQTPHDRLGPTEPDIDEFELALCAAAIARGLPVLGICRGMQVINVAAGGTLHQHLPEVIGSMIDHRQREPGRVATHSATVEPDTRLARLVGPAPLVVNSFHHQGIDRLADGLRVAARAADGLIEAIEGAGPALLLGVQWHVESLIEEPAHMGLVEALVAAARTVSEPEPERHPATIEPAATTTLGQIAA